MTSFISKALEQIAKHGGLKALGAILASRKGIFGILIVVASYFGLLGRLPENTDPAIVENMAEVFGLVLGTVSVMFIGGTAFEDGMEKLKGKTEAPAADTEETKAA